MCIPILTRERRVNKSFVTLAPQVETPYQVRAKSFLLAGGVSFA